MYQRLLTRRYLTSKVMPLLAALAVVLCTAMVLISWSVMGGFLKNLMESGRTLIGDVSINWPNAGFAHYEDLIQRLEAHPEIDAASPMIETAGMLALPGDRLVRVIVRGIDGPSYAAVTTYEDTLYWQPLEEPLPKDDARRDWRLENHTRWQRTFNNGLTLTEPDPATGEPRPAVVIGIETSGYNFRQPAGFIIPGIPLVPGADGVMGQLPIFLPDEKVTLHVLPIDSSGRGIEMVTRILPVANEFRSGLYEIDKQTVLVNLRALQSMLNMDEARRVIEDPTEDLSAADPFALGGDEADPNFEPIQRVEIDPARVTDIVVLGRQDDARLTQQYVLDVYTEFAAAHPDVPRADAIFIKTWEDQNATMIAAVKKETALVLFIFSFISLTAVFLVLAIFWAMVSEKTRDVGILRAFGASRTGIAWLWLRYGLAIGVVGSIFGLALAYTIVYNINTIHDWMGVALGISIWDPAVYYFTEIPSRVNHLHAAIIGLGGMLASTLGALWPALRAARMNPVRALRFE